MKINNGDNADVNGFVVRIPIIHLAKCSAAEWSLLHRSSFRPSSLFIRNGAEPKVAFGHRYIVITSRSNSGVDSMQITMLISSNVRFSIENLLRNFFHLVPNENCWTESSEKAKTNERSTSSHSAALFRSRNNLRWAKRRERKKNTERIER